MCVAGERDEEEEDPGAGGADNQPQEYITNTSSRVKRFVKEPKQPWT